MKAIILAAGRGERMRPLTDTKPKPLLEVHGKPLIQYHIEALKKAGVTDIVVNVAWLAEQLIAFLGDGSQFGVSIAISHEKDGALETAGGICKALPLLGKEAFIVVNGDVFTDYDFSQLPTTIEDDMHLVLVENPTHNPEGDFYFVENKILSAGKQKLTFSGIGIYQAHIFHHLPANAITPLRDLFQIALAKQCISAEHYRGQWFDIGTPERLNEINQS